MNPTHTPGPYLVSFNVHEDLYEVGTSAPSSDEEIEATMSLLQSAPDLLAALEAAKHYFGPHVIRSCGTCEKCGGTTPNGTLKICRKCVVEVMDAALTKAKER